ncbi:MAG: amino acid ABC transporter permease [Rhodospirillaceae bacterium]|nr:amino acid ABC transporter permease [Rhodospirillaceae bacterium]
MPDVIEQQEYPPGQHPSLPPPSSYVGPVAWLRTNLFSSPLNILLTLLAIWLIWAIVPPLLDWAIFSATFVDGESRDVCVKDGACWTMIIARFWQFMYGFYPVDERWRVDLGLILFFAAVIALLIERTPGKKYIAIFLFGIYPFISYWLFVGGFLGLGLVETRLWGGLFLTIVLGSTGIIFSLPLGILLALGRRSELPVIRMLSTAFIEFTRAIPLITVLFMSSVMLPLFLPEGVTFDKLLRAMIGIALFGAAYMAEVVRGGLQAVPRGQYEGAMAVGLGYWQMTGLIVMPQALRIVIPGIVNTFIGLFKDTTLVIVIGLFELLNIVQASFRDANWAGLAKEGYAFVAFVFFLFCFSMSRYSLYLERKLNTGHRR